MPPACLARLACLPRPPPRQQPPPARLVPPACLARLACLPRPPQRQQPPPARLAPPACLPAPVPIMAKVQPRPNLYRWPPRSQDNATQTGDSCPSKTKIQRLMVAARIVKKTAPAYPACCPICRAVSHRPSRKPHPAPTKPTPPSRPCKRWRSLWRAAIKSCLAGGTNGARKAGTDASLARSNCSARTNPSATRTPTSA